MNRRLSTAHTNATRFAGARGKKDEQFVLRQRFSLFIKNDKRRMMYSYSIP